MKPLFIVVLLLFSASTFSQESELSVQLISKELKENTNAIIRHNITEVSVNSSTSMIVKKRKVVTVLNRLGKADASMAVGYDNDTKVTKLFAKIYDGTGNLIKKYSKGKFLDISAVDGGTLYSDDRVKYLDYTPTTYPYTVVFESEYKTSSTGFIPLWFPTNGYYASVQKNEYILNYPLDKKVRIKKKNFNNYPISDLSKEGKVHFVLENLPAIKYESHGIHMREFMPLLSIAFNTFSLKGVAGYGENWKEFGKWMYDYLIKGRDILDAATVTKVRGLVKGIENPIEKAKIIYAFMQNRTRYISVQVGIGGWEPIAANKVDKVGYGDCKGLTNYTKALLDAVGVKSYYTVVFAKERRDIDKDFASLQGNHIILNIPNGEKEIWLECTNQTLPFGFLGDFTDDRNVLVVTPKGGVIKRTPKYINKDNLQTIKADIVLEPAGNVNVNLIRKSYGIQYNDKYFLADESKSDLEKYYKFTVWDYNNNLEIFNSKITNNKDKVEFTENLKLSINDYARVKDSSYLFRVNVLNKYTNIPKRYRKREKKLKISRGFYDKDEVIIKLPKGYHTTFLPQPKEIKTKFGYYNVLIEKINENSIKYSRELLLKEGIYPKEDYKKYRSFIKKIAKYDNLRLELTKQ